MSFLSRNPVKLTIPRTISAEIHASIERSGGEIVAHIEDHLVGTTGKLTSHIDNALGSSESAILTHFNHRFDKLQHEIASLMREEVSKMKGQAVIGEQRGGIHYKNVPSHLFNDSRQPVVPQDVSHIQQDSQCDTSCPCICHSSKTGSHYSWGVAALSPIMGSISVTWSGKPTEACTDSKCRETQSRRPTREVSILYKFPDWVTRAALSVLYSSNLNGTPELVIRVLNPIDGSRVLITESIFGYIARKDVAGIKKLLFERRGSVYDVWGRELQSPLAMAVMRGIIPIVKVLMQAGADPYQEMWVDGKSSRGVSVSSLALKQFLSHREAELPELLPIARQFDLEDRPVLHMAVTGFLHLDLASALQNPSHQPDINRLAMGGLTPLHLASMCGDLAAVRLLLRAGANINAPSAHTGTTPLHQACSTGRYPVAKLLIAAGADVNGRDYYGQTPLLTTAQHNHSEKTAYLITSLLTQNGANTEIPPSITSCGGSPLIFAAAFGSYGSVRALVEGGANSNFVDMDGDNALLGAVYHRNHESAELLLKNGTDLAHVNRQGRTVLHALARCADERMLEVFGRCEMKGLSTTAKDIHGKTPSQLFNEREGSTEELRVLFEKLLDMVEGHNWGGKVKGVPGEEVLLVEGQAEEEVGEFVDAKEVQED